MAPTDAELVAAARRGDRAAFPTLVARHHAALASGPRRAVVGYYLLGLPQREVAALLGTSSGAVKTRLHRVRASLTDALADDWTVREEHAMTERQAAVAMHVSDVCRVSREAMSYVVILEEVEGPRSLPIWVGERGNGCSWRARMTLV